MRTILHCDCNNFYASVEIAHDPSLRGKPLVVCGDPKLRHGIVLAKSYEARSCGIKTGEVLWQAKQKCPTLLTIPSDHRKYYEYSKMIRAICRRYTDNIEPFGLDENWLDVSGHWLSGDEIAHEIRLAAKHELDITVSVGVSYNKVFAKLASEMRGADATTVITPRNYQKKVWPLPSRDLLFVGHSTDDYLKALGLYTIGDIAKASASLLKTKLGKQGDMLRRFALGFDNAPVMGADDDVGIKSISNSTTPPQDMSTPQEAKPVLYLLADSVSSRLRSHHMLCNTVSVWLRDKQLNSIIRQTKLLHPSDISDEIAATAISLLETHWNGALPLRSLGIHTGGLIPSNNENQLPLFSDPQAIKRRKLDQALDCLRQTYGHTGIQRGLLLMDESLSSLNLVDDHALQPLSAMNGRG